ncbi:MAG TPA: ABC transporter permease [Candidatus Blautia pullicola]|jgi:peptide/nickel transport system permease protein|uniref:ABC transporter permease n=1 Tax=Candidatus Blautia pullicola TaxID=2838498 RepID=A0A9D2FQR9_9FIRM|nr:ABC transporter permease [Candidatus Blautia pullicola]
MTVLKKLLRNPSAVAGLFILLLLIIISIVGPFVVQSPYEQDTAMKLLPPSGEHWFGTDDFGRDVFSRIVTGAHYSLTAGFISVILGLTGGLMLGAFAGYYGGIADQVIMMLCNILLSFPSVLLAMAIVMVMEPGIYTPMVAVGVSSIPVFARLVRAQFMSLRESCFVEAVRSSGAGDMRIIFRHLLPNSIGPIIIQATLRIGSSILLAATLSFLGLGAQPPTPEWGSMLSAARNYIWTAPHLAIVPGMAITVTVISVNLIGDALRDYLDPRTRNM